MVPFGCSTSDILSSFSHHDDLLLILYLIVTSIKLYTFSFCRFGPGDAATHLFSTPEHASRSSLLLKMVVM